MQPLALFDMAYRQNDWLARRQSVITSNIANANTPGYKTKDLASFEHAMQAADPMATTHGAHFPLEDANVASAKIVNTEGTEVLHSGNDVSVEQEFLKSGEVTRSYSMNTQILKAFGRMLSAVTKV